MRAERRARWRVGAALAGLAASALLVRFVAGGGPGAAVASCLLGALVTGGAAAGVGLLAQLGRRLARSRRRTERAVADADRARRALAEREAQLAQAQSIASLGYWLLDLRSGLSTWSAELCRILGEDPVAVIPGPERWWQHVHPDDREALERSVAALLKEGGVVQREFRLIRTDGRCRWVYGRAEVIRAEDGRPSKLVGTVQDFTEQRELQAKLAASERWATVGTLATGVAHEINDPLASATHNLQYVLEELERRARPSAGGAAGDEELRVALEEALQGAERVRQVVRELMAFARPDQAAGPVDVERILEQALGFAGAQLHGRARLVKRYHRPPPVLGDATRLGQVFLHLILNAAQAIPPGAPERHEIRVETRAVDGAIVVKVRDTGAGMTAEVRRRIFDPFFTTRPSGSGMGLGLPTCMSIVRALGGDIAVESEPGRGSEFTVRLPRAA